MSYLIPLPSGTSTVAHSDDELIAILSQSFGKPGLSTRRAIDADEVKQALKALPEAKNRVRVYSSWGFVANSYKYRSEIQYVEAVKVTVDGEDLWEWSTGWGRAQRSFGKAATVVVQ